MLTAAILGEYSICFLDPSASELHRRSIIEAIRPDVIVDSSGLGKWEGAASAPIGDGAAGYIAMSSGSLGVPKGVLSPWSSLAAFIPHGAVALDLDRDACLAELSHLSFDMAMTNLLLALGSGARLHLSSALGDRLRPLKFVGRVGATHIRVAPRFLDLALAERTGLPNTTLRVWGSGGDRLFASQVLRIFERGVPKVVNTYGTSESVGFASAAQLTPGQHLPSLHGAVAIGSGVVGPWQAELLEVAEHSLIAIRTPHLPPGYFFGESVEDFPSWISSEVLVTGDVGTFDGAHFYCLGRSGRRVKRSGTFVDLDEVDAVLRHRAGVSSFTVMSGGGDIVCLVEADRTTIVELTSVLSSTLRPDMVPDQMIFVRELPRLDNGKINQKAAGDLVGQ